MHEGTKERIVAVAAGIMHRKGYLGTGLKEILDEAGVPKGSLYHYFKSKEDLGLAVVEYQGARLAEEMKGFAGDASLSPLTRLRNLFDRLKDGFEAKCYGLGCPLGNMAQEMGDLSESFRIRLHASMGRIIAWVAELIAEGQRAGEISPELDSLDTARFLMASWQGALISMKVTGDGKPLELFHRFAFALLGGHWTDSERRP